MDLGHYTPFVENAYTTITAFNNSQKFDKIKFYKYSIENKKPKFISNLKYSDFFVDNTIILPVSNFKNTFSEIYNIDISSNDIYVKNGFATLCDKVFIQDNFEFKSNVIDVLKVSTGEWKKCIFPYNENLKPLEFDKIEDKNLRNYLNQNKDTLLNRSTDKNVPWYCFGRTQAISDVKTYRIAINNTIKDLDSIKLNELPEGTGAYSGLYIMTNKYSLEDIKKAVYSEEFLQYIRSLNKCKSGGYFTFSSSDLKKYLLYRLENNMKNSDFLNVVSNSFKEYLISGANSNKKLVILHGNIAKNIKQLLGDEYSVHSLGIRR